jgi:DNA gyrase subunit A
MTMREDDFIEHLFIASTHDYILFITNEGKAYWLKVYEIPEGSRVSRGQSIKILFSLSPDEEVATILSLKGFSEETNVLIATSKGIVKKVKTIEFENAKTRGIIAIKLDVNDKVVSAKLTGGNDEIMLVTREGNALRFHEEAIRAMGRATRGVTGIRLSNKDELSGLIRVVNEEEMLILTENGYGKRIDCNNFSPHGRGTRGQVCYKTNEKTGQIVGLLSVKEDDDLVCITSQGNIIKLRINTIPIQGKSASGVRIVNIEKPDMVVGIAKAVEDEGEDEAE